MGRGAHVTGVIEFQPGNLYMVKYVGTVPFVLVVDQGTSDLEGALG